MAKSEEHIHRAMMAITELVRWAIIVAVIYLSVWQYCTYAGYTVFVVDSPAGVQGQFWGVFTGIIGGISLLLYLPWRVFSIRFREKYNITRDERWRPAILFYIVFCATPCFTLILVAYKVFTTLTTVQHMTPISVTVLQLVVMGLVITEWAVKIQQEKFTFQLVTAMALDFFFAYDVIAFVMMSTLDQPMYQSAWIYPCFVFAVVAMFKYVPTQPIGIVERGSSVGHVICILTSMFCNDIPFVVIRLATMIIFGFLISDMIFLLKNIFVIIFSCIQLCVIYSNLRHHNATAGEQWAKTTSQSPPTATFDGDDARPKSSVSNWQMVTERIIRDRREFRAGPEDVWCDPNDQVCVNRRAVGASAVRTAVQSGDDNGPTSAATATSGGNRDGVMTVDEYDNAGFNAAN